LQGAILAADDKADAANAKAVARHVIAKGTGFAIGPLLLVVGIENPPPSAAVPPLWMTSRDETAAWARDRPADEQADRSSTALRGGLGACAPIS
jgi:hypothetical protein